MRRIVAFRCGADTLVGSFDDGAATTGLLIVSGGNEIRCGAHRGMAELAATIAAAGYPVFRYDRRGIGDSTGDNGGFLSAAPDLAAAVAAFRTAAPQVTRMMGFGNCDAASTLALFGIDAGVDAVLLANPWTIEAEDNLPPAAAIRARYAKRIGDPGQWLRLLRGGVDLRKLARGLFKIARPVPSSALADRVTAAIRGWGASAHVVLAKGDATAVAFRVAARDIHATIVETDSHSFARGVDKAALAAWILARLAD